MKSNKDIVLEYMQQNSTSVLNNDIRKFTTQELSEELTIQRTNLSTILNALVKENKVEKLQGKPVYYKVLTIPGTVLKEQSCFKMLIGYDGSLKNAVQLAKAAILYPGHSLNTLIIGPSGSGKSYFAKMMYAFAKENHVIHMDAPFIKVNCRHYDGEEENLYKRLFENSSDELSAVDQASGGVLFIDHIDFLPIKAKEMLFDLIEHENTKLTDVILICAGNDTMRKPLLDAYCAKFSVQIELPQLADWKIEERFILVQEFLQKEAFRMKRIIHINSELLRCILLYRCEHNVKQLKSDIKVGCANAYVREFERNHQELYMYMNDFPAYVRKGFLFYKDNKDSIENLIPQNYSYTFSDRDMGKIEENAFVGTEGSDKDETVYDIIDRKVVELKERGIKEEDISTIINTDLENDMRILHKRLNQKKINKESISKVVDLRIVTIVEKFIQEASNYFGRIYPEATFYGLCLHLSATIDKPNQLQRLSNTQIMETIHNNPDEYNFCMKFSTQLEKEFDIQLPIDEVVFITMFITDRNAFEETRRPVVLIAMHGAATASSMADAVNALVRCDNVYAFDLSLELDMHQAYEDLKKKILEIDQGKGIVFLYDMGSLKTMVDTIVQETAIPIRTIEIPSTLIALDISRKASSATSLDEIAIDMGTENAAADPKAYQRQDNSKVIVTLCMSGKGAAVQMKNYLENNMPKDKADVVALAISDRATLMDQVNRIRKDHQIIYVIGTYDPKLYGIPFISVSQLFQTPADKLNMLLALEEVKLPETVDFEGIYTYLKEQLPGLDITLLKRTLPRIITKIKKRINGMSLDMELGLFLHIACSIWRFQQNEEIPVNVHRESILSKNKRLYNDLKDYLKPIEEEFIIEFNDDELANIIGIIRQI